MMNNEKIGISAALFSALAYVAGYISFTAAAVVFGVALLANIDVVAKKNATLSLLLAGMTSILISVFSLISTCYLEIVNLFSSLPMVYSVLTKLNFSSNIIDLINFVYLIVTIIACVAALKGSVVKLPGAKLVEKHFSQEQ